MGGDMAIPGWDIDRCPQTHWIGAIIAQVAQPFLCCCVCYTESGTVKGFLNDVPSLDTVRFTRFNEVHGT